MRKEQRLTFSTRQMDSKAGFMTLDGNFRFCSGCSASQRGSVWTRVCLHGNWSLSSLEQVYRLEMNTCKAPPFHYLMALGRAERPGLHCHEPPSESESRRYVWLYRSITEDVSAGLMHMQPKTENQYSKAFFLPVNG